METSVAYDGQNAFEDMHQYIRETNIDNSQSWLPMEDTDNAGDRRILLSADKPIVAKININPSTAQKELFVSMMVRESEFNGLEMEFGNIRARVNIENVLATNVLNSEGVAKSVTYSQRYEGKSPSTLRPLGFAIEGVSELTIYSALEAAYKRFIGNLRKLNLMFPADKHSINACIFNYSKTNNGSLSLELTVLNLKDVLFVEYDDGIPEPTGFILR